MIGDVFARISALIQKYKINAFKSKLGYIGKNVVLVGDFYCNHPENIFIYDNSHIFGPFTYIGINGKFVLKNNSCGVQGLTVITGGHNRTIGKYFNGGEDWPGRSYDLDIIVEEDVWIGCNVTLLGGCTIGRGANIGAGSVVRNSIPPYAIVSGNPGKVVGFCYTPNEIIEHEKAIYSESDRLSLDLLEKNYEKYFLRRIKEIKQYSRI